LPFYLFVAGALLTPQQQHLDLENLSSKASDGLLNGPGSIARNPSPDCLRVSFVRIAKPSSQDWFLVERHEQMRQDQENSSLDQNRHGDEEYRLAY
jgi:hypothetical protein